jgi:hypothetical protein
MSNLQPKITVAILYESGMFLAALGIAVGLCIVCCALILSVPTESINVDTVYQGF